MRAVTAKEHAAAQWVLDSLRSGRIRTDQFNMLITCSRDRTVDHTITACLGGWMYLYMMGAHEKQCAQDIIDAQTYVHNIQSKIWSTSGEDRNPLYDLYYPPCGTRNVTREDAIVALRTFLATEIPIWPHAEAAHA